MTITHIPDHEAQGTARIIERYRKPRNIALLASWLSEVQQVEDAFWDLLMLRSVATANDHALDVLGKIVGQPRQGRSNELYRVWVAARILVSRSSGTTVQLIRIAKKLAGGVQIKLEEYYPASFLLRAQVALDAATGGQIAELLALAKGAGIAMHFTWSSAAAGPTFRFAPADAVVSGSPNGFGAGALAAVSDGTSTPVFA